MGAPTAEALYGGGTQAERFPQVLSEADFRRIAEECIDEYFANTGETRRREVTFLRATSLRLPAGEITTKASLTAGVRYTGSTPIRIQIFINGRLYRSLSVYYQIRLYDTVLVATHDLRVDEPVMMNDVRTQEITVTSDSAKYLKNISDIEGRVPARAIKADTPLTESLFQQPIAIEAGAPVTIMAKYGAVSVNAMGVALQRGRLGQIIRVRNTASGKMLLAKVVDGQTVEITGKI